MIICPHCRAENQDGRTFCRKCGGQLNKAAKAGCIACGYPLEPNAQSCDRCGAPQHKTVTKAASSFWRKGKSTLPATRPLQADIETIMVIEDRPAFKAKAPSGSAHATATTRMPGAGPNTDHGRRSHAKSAAPAGAADRKQGSGESSSKTAGRRTPLAMLGITLAVTGILVASLSFLAKERTRTGSAPLTEVSPPAETAVQSPAAATTATQPLPMDSASSLSEPVQTPPATPLHTIVPESPNATSSSAAIAAEASPPATPRTKTRTTSTGALRPSSDSSAEQRHARKQAKDTPKELLKQE